VKIVILLTKFKIFLIKNVDFVEKDARNNYELCVHRQKQLILRKASRHCRFANGVEDTREEKRLILMAYQK